MAKRPKSKSSAESRPAKHIFAYHPSAKGSKGEDGSGIGKSVGEVVDLLISSFTTTRVDTTCQWYGCINIDGRHIFARGESKDAMLQNLSQRIDTDSDPPVELGLRWV